MIIPHPSVREFKNTYYDKSLRVVNDEDAANKLISGCKFVLSISPTTLANCCVLYIISLLHLFIMIKWPKIYGNLKS